MLSKKEKLKIIKLNLPKSIYIPSIFISYSYSSQSPLTFIIPTSLDLKLYLEYAIAEFRVDFTVPTLEINGDQYKIFFFIQKSGAP